MADQGPLPWTPRPRKEPEPAVTGAAAWDNAPVWKWHKGEQREFFYIGAICIALGKKPVTIRKWIREGIIPDASYRAAKRQGKAARRMWSRPQVEAIIRAYRECGMDKRRDIPVEFITKVEKYLGAVE